MKTLKKGVVEITDGPHGAGTIFIIVLLILVAAADYLIGGSGQVIRVQQATQTTPALSAVSSENTATITFPVTSSLPEKALRAKP